MAPEVLKNEPDYDPKKVDSWLVGSLFIRLIATDLTLEKNSSSKQINEAASDPRWRKSHPDITSIIERFLEKDPDHRDTVEIVYANNKNKFKKGLTYDADIKVEKNRILELDSLIFYHMMVHDYNQAINYCKKLYYITEDERVLFSQADCYLLNGNFEQAHSLYIRVLKASHRGFDMNMYWNLLLGITYTEFQLFRNQKAELANFFQQIDRKSTRLNSSH